ncbi:hypothetical protein [Caulobacter sp.]|uniref:hypothetical protein n=1 Tax=Caulobacter sp. TaxID=78 RepID=UPI003BAF2FE3
MNGPNDPLRRSARHALPALRDVDRPEADDAEEAVFADEEPQAPPRQPQSRRNPYAAFAAHLMGQTGQKRGLRGGQEVLDTARSTYLGTEFSGPADRRPKAGLIKKTEI